MNWQMSVNIWPNIVCYYEYIFFIDISQVFSPDFVSFKVEINVFKLNKNILVIFCKGIINFSTDFIFPAVWGKQHYANFKLYCT